MSRAYHIEVREAFEIQVTGTDKIESQLQLLKLVNEDRLRQLLCLELEGEGFVENNGLWEKNVVKDERGEVSLIIDPQTGKIQVCSKVDRAGKFVAARSEVIMDSPEQAMVREEELKQLAKKDAEGEINAQSAQADKLAGDLLEKALPLAREIVNRVTHRVTVLALKEKAESMGRVQSMEEDSGNRRLTIVLEV